MSNESFESVIPTAILSAYPRTLTDIPYSQEVFNELKKEPHSPKLIKLAPEIEARYKLLDKLLKESGINQVLELASGYSTRGLDFAKKDINSSYVEIDLPEVCVRKRDILGSIADIPKNLHIIAGSAVDKNDVERCEEFFKPGPVAVINEGLLRYLNFEEKKQVAKNVFNILSKHGGVWITCDVTPKKFIANQDVNLPDFNKNLSDVSDRNNNNWRFNDIDHVKKFMEEVGLVVESVHSFTEVADEILSGKKLGLNQEQIHTLLVDAVVAVMRVK